MQHISPAGTAGRSARGRTRALHLIDIDNLLGDPLTDDADHIARTFAGYRALAGAVPGDHVAVATAPNPRHAYAIKAAWPGVTHMWRGGRDGADLALLEVAGWALEIDGFTRVVIGSGDRIFLTALECFEARDVPVEVVACRRSLATALRTRARTVRFLPDLPLATAA
jgi:hypothetical protein